MRHIHEALCLLNFTKQEIKEDHNSRRQNKYSGQINIIKYSRRGFEVVSRAFLGNEIIAFWAKVKDNEGSEGIWEKRIKKQIYFPTLHFIGFPPMPSFPNACHSQKTEDIPGLTSFRSWHAISRSVSVKSAA